MGATFLVCHGAWSAGWAWKKMHPLMAARGHRLVTPTYTGLGEREHLANPSIDLETHIQDILNVTRDANDDSNGDFGDAAEDLADKDGEPQALGDCLRAHSAL